MFMLREVLGWSVQHLPVLRGVAVAGVKHAASVIGESAGSQVRHGVPETEAS